MRDLDITEVARRAGVPASTLRYYEERGLIAPAGRRGGRRVFAGDVLERLGLIALGRAAGFSLGEIAPMLGPGGVGPGGPHVVPRIDRQALAAKAEVLDARVRELTAVRDGLRHAAACPAPSHMACPTFRRVLRAATSGALARRRRAALAVPVAAGRGAGG